MRPASARRLPFAALLWALLFGPVPAAAVGADAPAAAASAPPPANFEPALDMADRLSIRSVVTMRERGPLVAETTAQGSGGLDAMLRTLYRSPEVNVRRAAVARFFGSDLARGSIVTNSRADESTPFLIRLGSGSIDGSVTFETAWVGLPLQRLAKAVLLTLKTVEQRSRPGAAPGDEDSAVLAPGAGPDVYSLRIQWRYEVTPPPEFAGDALPPDRMLTLGPATLSQRAQVQADGSVAIDAEFRSEAAEYTPAQLSAVRGGLERIAQESGRLEFPLPAYRAWQKGDERAALSLYRRLVDEAPQNAFRHAVYADGLEKLCLIDQARAELRRAIELQPDYGYAYIVLGWRLMADEVCRTRGTPLDVAGAERAFREAIRLLPQDASARYGLAQLLEYSPSGVRFGHGARLEESAAEFRALRGLPGYHNEYDDEFLDVLLMLGRAAELESAADAMPPSPYRQRMRLAATFLAHGAPATLEAAAHDAAGENAVREALAAAAGRLTSGRYYESAAALLELGAAERGKSSERDAQLAFVRRVRHHEVALFPSADPRTPVVHTLEVLLSSVIDLSSLSTQLSRALHAKQTPTEFASSWVTVGTDNRRQSQAWQGDDRLIDFSLAQLDFAADGDERSGFRVRVSGWAPEPWTFFVVHDAEGPHVLGTAFAPAAVGSWVLAELDADHADVASRWLDRVRESLPAQAAGLFEGFAFTRLWPGEGSATPEDMRVAAAALAVTSKANDRELAILRSAYEHASGERRRAVGAALASGYLDGDRWRELAEVLRPLLADGPHSDVGVAVLAEAYAFIGDSAAADRLISSNWSKPLEDARALRARATVEFAREHTAEGRRLLGALIKARGATDADLSQFGWHAVAEATADPAAIDAIRDVVTRARNHNPAAQHTLACLYAIAGRGREAREQLQQVVTGYGGVPPPGAIALAQGLLAESYGLLDLARRFYERAGTAPDRADPWSSAFMARRRLALLAGRATSP
jgi:hypothetical protein